jgi:outer membrane protein assembly factor BamB
VTRNAFRVSSVSLVLAALGCGVTSGGAHPEMPTFITRPSGSMSVIYDRPVIAASRVVGEPYERGQAELDLVGRRVFVGSSDHGLYAVRAEDGSVLWRFETLGFVNCAPLYSRGEDARTMGRSTKSRRATGACSGVS